MYKHLVHGDPSKLDIHPTAVVNNALFNVGSGTITVGEYAFFGHNVSVLTGTHDITTFGRERQLTIPRPGATSSSRRAPGWPATPWCWGRAGSAPTPWSAGARW